MPPTGSPRLRFRPRASAQHDEPPRGLAVFAGLAVVRRLADHRRQYNDFEVRLANIYDIYNEFSSGKTDPSALRNFIKMLYSRGNAQIRVLLFGDGS